MRDLWCVYSNIHSKKSITHFIIIMASFPSTPAEIFTAAAFLTTTGSYQNRNAYQWYGILHNGMLKERRDEPGAAELLTAITGLSKDQYYKYQCDRFIAACWHFKKTGEGYDELMGRMFPLFRGEPPEGHPYPEAFSGSGEAVVFAGVR